MKLNKNQREFIKNNIASYSLYELENILFQKHNKKVKQLIQNYIAYKL